MNWVENILVRFHWIVSQICYWSHFVYLKFVYTFQFELLSISVRVVVCYKNSRIWSILFTSWKIIVSFFSLQNKRLLFLFVSSNKWNIITFSADTIWMGFFFFSTQYQTIRWKKKVKFLNTKNKHQFGS